MYKEWGNLKKIWSSYGVQTHFKGSTTIRQMLVRPKDKDYQSNVIYSYQCKGVDCDEEYIGETSRTLRKRYREHLKEPSPIHAHSFQTGHNANEDNFNILGREDLGLTRLIKDSIYIKVNNPTLNKNICKFNLSQIWDRVLYNTSCLRLNNNKGQVQYNVISHHNSLSPHGSTTGTVWACSEFRACAQRFLGTYRLQ